MTLVIAPSGEVMRRKLVTMAIHSTAIMANSPNPASRTCCCMARSTGMVVKLIFSRPTSKCPWPLSKSMGRWATMAPGSAPETSPNDATGLPESSSACAPRMSGSPWMASMIELTTCSL